MTEPTPNTSQAQQARRLLLRHVLKALPEVVTDVSALLDKMPDPGDSTEKLQAAETLRRQWVTAGLLWQRGTGQRLLGQASTATSDPSATAELRLLDEEDVDILAWALGTLSVPDEYAGPLMDAFRKLDYVEIPH